MFAFFNSPTEGDGRQRPAASAFIEFRRRSRPPGGSSCRPTLRPSTRRSATPSPNSSTRSHTPTPLTAPKSPQPKRPATTSGSMTTFRSGANLQADGHPWEWVTEPVHTGSTGIAADGRVAGTALLHRSNPAADHRRAATSFSLRLSRSRKSAAGDHAAVERRLVGASRLLGDGSDPVRRSRHSRPSGTWGHCRNRDNGSDSKCRSPSVGLNPGAKCMAGRSHSSAAPSTGTRPVW